MAKEISFNVTLVVKEETIKPGDLFYFPQYGGLPTIRRAKEKEDWNGWTNSKTGENPYLKIKEIKGVLLSPKETFKY